jgi:hypothetical protein
MKLALHFALLAVLICGSARAQEYEHGTALLCDTQEQAERYVALFNGKAQSAIEAVNAEERDPTACALETVAFVRGPELGTARNGRSAFQIIRILVVGVKTSAGFRPTRPSAFFSAFQVVEYEV